MRVRVRVRVRVKVRVRVAQHESRWTEDKPGRVRVSCTTLPCHGALSTFTRSLI